MKVTQDGKTVAAPSRSPPDHPENKTYEGQMVISDKFKETRMNGATVGFTDDDGKGEYDIKDVPHAMRLSTSGTFIEHGNYWGAKSIFGSANTSHGCVGLADNARALTTRTRPARGSTTTRSSATRRSIAQTPATRAIAPDNGLERLEHGLGSRWKAGSAL
ncbi:Lipoprotein OS=Streptomyces griseomycini OX=66895 GN=FHS37_001349 PE=4 SV=1 [Streptomyces griseomycini]